jgi:hypothetical protein
MDQLSGLPGKVVCQPIQPPFVQEIEIQLVPKGTRFTQIDCIEQGPFRGILPAHQGFYKAAGKAMIQKEWDDPSMLELKKCRRLNRGE